jgi:hypothetical protein
VVSALERSCGRSMVQPRSYASLVNGERSGVWVIVAPLEEWSGAIVDLLAEEEVKVILFGRIPDLLAAFLSTTTCELDESLEPMASCPPAPAYAYSESDLKVHYVRSVAGIASPIPIRPLMRYDFSDEWNNLGYGAIRADGGAWSIMQMAHVPEGALVASVMAGEEQVTAYTALWDNLRASLLWFNRPVGPVDSNEWRLVEAFLANHRASELICVPVIRDIPYGYDAAVTMRLDCDEDVESARALFDSYQRMGVPLSLALHTRILPESRHHALPAEVLEAGGAILSHTATHAPDWGGSYAAAYEEARRSAAEIEDITGEQVRYAVSPFHQTPEYARTALADAGYAGCIGGIIRNDPDFLMARAGAAPGSTEGFVGHSQQCMLHGDCMLEADDQLLIYRQAFEQSLAGHTFFGYLDHPFSERYQYGWQDERQRIDVHQQFIAYIREHGNILFCNEDDAMDFLQYKASVQISPTEDGFSVQPPVAYQAKWPAAVEYAGELYAISQPGILL